MDISFLFLPITSALLGWVVIWVTAFLILRHIREERPALTVHLMNWAQSNMISKASLVEKARQLDIANDVTLLLTTRIDGVLEKFVAKNPMVGMFLNEGMKASIKNTVIEEVISNLPESQAALAEKALDRVDIKQWANQALQDLDWNNIQAKIETGVSQALFPAKCLAAGIGFGFGVFQATLLWLLL